MTTRAAGIQFVGSVIGDKELKVSFRRLEDKAKGKVARRAISRGLNVITRAIRKSIPKAITKGHSNKRLKSAVGQVVLRRNRKADLIESKAGTNVGKKKGKQAPHLPLFLMGTAARVRKKSGGSTGKVLPKHRNVVPSAVRQASPAAVRKIGEDLWAGIKKLNS